MQNIHGSARRNNATNQDLLAVVVNHGFGKDGVGHVKLNTFPSIIIAKNYNSIVNYYNSGYNE